MENSNIVTYDSQQDTISSSRDMIRSHNKRNSATTNALHLKVENREYLKTGYPSAAETHNTNQINRMEEQSSAEIVNTTSFIIDEQLDPLSERDPSHPVHSMETMENIIEKRLRTMEENLKHTIKKRIKKMEKKIVELQKSMLSDMFFLYRDQPGAIDVETAGFFHQNEATSKLPETPINSIEKFNEFEQKLKCDAKLQNNLISSFLTINCTSPGKYIRICWSKLLTDEVAVNFSRTKSSIYNSSIAKTIKKAFALKFPLKQEKFNTFTQKYFQNAKDRTVKLQLNSESNVVQGKTSTTNLRSSSTEITEAAQPSTSTAKIEMSEFHNPPASAQSSEQSTNILSIIESEGSQSGALHSYKGRKKIGQLKCSPKTSAQRSREYRLRKKRSKTLSDRQSQSNDSSTSVPFLDDINTLNSEFSQESVNNSKIDEIPGAINNSIPYIQNSVQNTFCNVSTNIDIAEYAFSRQSDCGQSSQTNDDTSQEYSAILYDESFWKPPGMSCGSRERKTTEKPKTVPKTSAERSRAYRIRKRIQMAAALQKEQLAIECFSNTDPLSQDSESMH